MPGCYKRKISRFISPRLVSLVLMDHNKRFLVALHGTNGISIVCDIISLMKFNVGDPIQATNYFPIKAAAIHLSIKLNFFCRLFPVYKKVSRL